MNTELINNKQPRTLSILFSTELWERFSYFAVMSLLVLYMTKSFNFSDVKAYSIFSAYGALMFITPVIGGFLADRFIGNFCSVIIGIIFLALGYFILASGSEKYFFAALSFIIWGNGFFKPNISSLLGTVYKKIDPRRETGFTLFYIGINLGAMIGVILCGFASKIWSFNYAFLITGIGVLIGFLIFIFNVRAIKRDQIKVLFQDKKRKYLIARGAAIIFGVFALTFFIIFALKHPDMANIILEIFAGLIIVYILWEIINCQKHDRNKFIVCIILIIFSIAFWALFQQSFMSTTLYISRAVNLNFFGIVLPPSTIGSLNGIFLILLAPVTIKIFAKLRKHVLEPSMITKFALGIGLMGFGYIVLAYGTIQVTMFQKASLFSVAISYALQTLGEICLSPVGLAMVTVLVPEKLRSMMLGIWFFALAAATAIAGQLAKMADVTNLKIDLVTCAHVYGHAFMFYGILAISIGVILAVISPKLNKLL